MSQFLWLVLLIDSLLMLLLGYRNVEIKHSLSCTGCIKNTVDSFSSDGKESACNAADLGSISGLGRSLEEGTATYSSILARRIPGTGEPGGLQSLVSHRVRRDWATFALGSCSLIPVFPVLTPCLTSPAPSLPPSFKVSAILVAYWQQIFWILPALAHILFCVWNVVLWIPLPDNIL